MIPVECGDGREHWRLEVVAVRNHPAGDKMSVASSGDQAVERVRCGWRGEGGWVGRSLGLWCPLIGSSSVCPAPGSAQEVGSSTSTVRTPVWSEVNLSKNLAKSLAWRSCSGNVCFSDFERIVPKKQRSEREVGDSEGGH